MYKSLSNASCVRPTDSLDCLWFTPLVRPMVSLSFTVVPPKNTHGLPQELP
nr:MAG TPA: hypothetical protein [Caudoviricetes sp.]